MAFRKNRKKTRPPLVFSRENVPSMSTSCDLYKVLGPDLEIKLAKYPNKEHTFDLIWLAPIGHLDHVTRTNFVVYYWLFFPNLLDCNPFIVAIILYSSCVALEFVLKKVRNVLFCLQMTIAVDLSVCCNTRHCACAPAMKTRWQRCTESPRGWSKSSFEFFTWWKGRFHISVFPRKEKEVGLSCRPAVGFQIKAGRGFMLHGLKMFYKIEYCYICICFHQLIWPLNYK